MVGKISICICSLILLVTGCSRHYEDGPRAPKPPPKSQVPDDHPPIIEQTDQSQGSVSGKVAIAPELADRVPANGVLFIIAKERAEGGPPPYAVKRMKISEFPMSFSLTQSDILSMAGGGLVLADIPEMYLVAKIDQDGNVGDQSGDMEGECITNPVASGTSDCEILINRVF